MGLKTQYLIANKQTKKWIFSCWKMGNKFKNGRTQPASPYKLFHNSLLLVIYPLSRWQRQYFWMTLFALLIILQLSFNIPISQISHKSVWNVKINTNFFEKNGIQGKWRKNHIARQKRENRQKWINKTAL